MSTLTLLDEGRELTLDAVIAGDSIRLSPDTVAGGLGWTLRAEGLCRGDVCVPVRDRGALVHADGLELAVLAALLDRPLASDAAEGVAVLGTSAAERGARLRSLDAPDVVLPDLDGRPHALSEVRGRKALLLAWAGW